MNRWPTVPVAPSTPTFMDRWFGMFGDNQEWKSKQVGPTGRVTAGRKLKFEALPNFQTCLSKEESRKSRFASGDRSSRRLKEVRTQHVKLCIRHPCAETQSACFLRRCQRQTNKQRSSYTVLTSSTIPASAPQSSSPPVSRAPQLASLVSRTGEGSPSLARRRSSLLCYCLPCRVKGSRKNT
jgi:hypothetical protein